VTDKEYILLIDYGSTFTKVAVVETTQNELLGTASAYTSIETDINEGFENALSILKHKTGITAFNKRLACSSAAGGLQIIASGLVPELTAKAASLASMGAGAKVVGLYSYELTQDDITEIIQKSPDIMLLTGGTDGGNKKCILHNAKLLSEASVDFPIIVAGNRSCSREVMQLLANHTVYLCDNVMPTVSTLNIEPARQKIREIFLERIVHAKGLSDNILMPTPAAVLAASQLLAGEIGDMITIDVGGATTDIYSMTNGTPQSSNTLFRGLPEPYAKRTVEGDIGMRISASGIVETAGIERLVEVSGLSVKYISEKVQYYSENTNFLPVTTEQQSLDFALASVAIETAIKRHAGEIEEVYTIAGRAFMQSGKDLSDVKTIVMTGGALLHSSNQKELAKYALYNEKEPFSLRPKRARLYSDKSYIMAAMGLLGTYKPKSAIEIMKKSVLPV